MIGHLYFLISLLIWRINFHANTYSTLIPDQDIEAIIGCELEEMVSLGSIESLLPDRVDHDIVDWKKIDNLDIHALYKIEDVIGYETEDTLMGMPTLFSEADFKYMLVQVEQQIGKQWHLTQNRVNFVNNKKRDCSHFSIPLFNEVHDWAIIYEEEVYSEISSCGIIKIYKKNENEWKVYKSMLIWLI